MKFMVSNDFKKYSVLMSVYHEENPFYLKESIDSMLQQTLKPEQIVIVKDGPLTIELEQILKEYEKNFKSIFTILSLKENLGLGKALDKGLEVCRNELVARMDTDDISLPDRCEKQVMEFIKNPKLCLVGSNIDEFYDNPKNVVSSRVVPSEHKDITKFILRRSPFNHPSVMFKKSEVIRVGGYGEFRRKQDLDLFSRMINGNCISMNIDESLVLFRSNKDSFKRRKSWSYCKSYIEVQFQIWKRGHCGTSDLIYVIVGQMILYLSPLWLMKLISNKYLRQDGRGRNIL